MKKEYEILPNAGPIANGSTGDVKPVETASPTESRADQAPSYTAKAAVPAALRSYEIMPSDVAPTDFFSLGRLSAAWERETSQRARFDDGGGTSPTGVARKPRPYEILPDPTLVSIPRDEDPKLGGSAGKQRVYEIPPARETSGCCGPCEGDQRSNSSKDLTARGVTFDLLVPDCLAPNLPAVPLRLRKEIRGSSASAAETGAMIREVSAATLQARNTPYADSINTELRNVMKETDVGSAALLHLWCGDNLRMLGRHQEAIEIYREFESRYGPTYGDKPSLLPHVFEQMAFCYEQLGDAEEAIRAHERCLKAPQSDDSRASQHFNIARIFLNHGSIERAIYEYSQAAQLATLSQNSSGCEGGIHGLSLRNIHRLREGSAWIVADMLQLVAKLSRALANKDTQGLKQLASRSHFSVGAAAGEFSFVEREEALAILLKDLQQSSGVVAALEPDTLLGDKAIVRSSGWRGEVLYGDVLLQIGRVAGGWEWSGIALTVLPEGAENHAQKILPGFVPRENQDLELSIKSPWPSGMHFTAGGFGYRNVVGSALSIIPFIGNILAGFSSCHYGLRGFWYNSPWSGTHRGLSAFAIDFVRYAELVAVPGFSDANMVPVLACADGFVGMIRNTTRTGVSSQLANEVALMHFLQSGGSVIVSRGAARVAQPPGPRWVYTSRYLHLAGPGTFSTPTRVSIGMFVAQGTRIGHIDDTGNSVLPHLHFEVCDNRITLPLSVNLSVPGIGGTIRFGAGSSSGVSLGIPATIRLPGEAGTGMPVALNNIPGLPPYPTVLGPSVRPTPMSGQRLGGDFALDLVDDGSCVPSNNRMIF
ncbi:MAG: hypothetical protein HY909_05980 [Deltaproteobacteria bacterium]|nr:hypothetical protein [Deltaproteobacteria bacterium]